MCCIHMNTSSNSAGFRLVICSKSYLLCICMNISMREVNIAIIFIQFFVHWHSAGSVACANGTANRQFYLKNIYALQSFCCCKDST